MNEAERRDARTLGLPLHHGHTAASCTAAVIGFLEVYNREPRRVLARATSCWASRRSPPRPSPTRGCYRELDKNARRAALLSESALELGSGLDLRSTLVTAARRLCDSVGVPECEITVLEGDELTTLMRVAHDEVDAEWIGRRISLADAAVSREVIETKRPSVVGSLRRPAPHARGSTRSTRTSRRRAGPRCR